MTPKKGFMGAVRRFFATPEQLEDERRADEIADAGAEPLRECAARTHVVVCGQIESVHVNKQGGGGWLEADVNDGTGHLKLVWMGRKQIPGIEVGRTIRVAGRLAARDDELVLYNPDYDLYA